MITIVLNFLMKYWVYILVVILGGLLYLSHITVLKERAAKEIAQSNYVAVDQGTKVFTTKLGNLAATVNALQLSNEQLSISNNHHIQELLAASADMGNKLSKTNTLIAGYGQIIDKFSVVVIHDTVIAGKKYKDYETYTTNNLNLTRMLLLNSDSANYLYDYHNKLFATISTFKVGKWKLANLFKRRKVDSKLTVTSDDKNYKIDSLLLIQK